MRTEATDGVNLGQAAMFLPALLGGTAIIIRQYIYVHTLYEGTTDRDVSGAETAGLRGRMRLAPFYGRKASKKVNLFHLRSAAETGVFTV